MGANFLGTNPTKMDDDVYSSSFEVFKSHMFVRPESAPVDLIPGHGVFGVRRLMRNRRAQLNR